MGGLNGNKANLSPAKLGLSWAELGSKMLVIHFIIYVFNLFFFFPGGIHLRNKES